MLMMKKLMFAIAIMVLIGIIYSMKTILAHEGEHHHTTPEQKTQREQKDYPNIDQKPKDFSTVKKQKVTVILEKSPEFNPIPKTSELIFFLLIANPILLKVIKEKIYQKES